MDLWLELQSLMAQLNKAVEMKQGIGKAFAKAEYDYKVLLRQEILKLRDAGESIGVITKICYGIPSVAEKRFLRDVAQTTYEANQEAINNFKLQIKIVESQLQREWSSNS